MCGSDRTQTEYAASMWHHRHERKPVCLDCGCPPCSGSDCRTCTTCRNPGCVAAPGQCTAARHMLHHKAMPTLAQQAQFRCTNCPQTGRLECSICQQLKDSTDFSKSMVHNQKDRVTVCFECGCPPCSVPTCQTCKTCRNPRCAAGVSECTAVRHMLHHKAIPMMTQQASFRCSRCQECGRPGCQKAMPKRIAQAWKAECRTETWYCAACHV